MKRLEKISFSNTKIQYLYIKVIRFIWRSYNQLKTKTKGDDEYDLIEVIALVALNGAQENTTKVYNGQTCHEAIRNERLKTMTSGNGVQNLGAFITVLPLSEYLVLAVIWKKCSNSGTPTQELKKSQPREPRQGRGIR